MIPRRTVVVACLLGALAPLAACARAAPAQSDGATDDTAAAGSAETSMSVDQAMSGAPMAMPHMTMTPRRAATAADSARADSIVRTLRTAIARYADYRVALADGFAPFAPKVPQKVYHFTSRRNAIRSAFEFDASRPTSLLYEKTADGYRLVGAMYTAPRRFTPGQLDARVPLGIAQWHLHTNICVPGRNARTRWLERENGQPKFGPRGTIATKAACDAEHGIFFPTVFGWMVHVNL